MVVGGAGLLEEEVDLSVLRGLEVEVEVRVYFVVIRVCCGGGRVGGQLVR